MPIVIWRPIRRRSSCLAVPQKQDGNLKVNPAISSQSHSLGKEVFTALGFFHQPRENMLRLASGRPSPLLTCVLAASRISRLDRYAETIRTRGSFDRFGIRADSRSGGASPCTA